MSKAFDTANDLRLEKPRIQILSMAETTAIIIYVFARRPQFLF